MQAHRKASDRLQEPSEARERHHGNQTNDKDRGEKASGSQRGEETSQASASQIIGEDGHLDQPAGRAIQGTYHGFVSPARALAPAASKKPLGNRAVTNRR